MKHYLIDSENVGDFWIPLLEIPAESAELIVFYTKNSPHMSYDSLIKLKESDRTVTFIKCYEGTNALDFQLCSELGYRIACNENDDFIIVTNDTGYDAAVKYWRHKEYSVKRIAGKDMRSGSRRRGNLARCDVAAEVSAILHKLMKAQGTEENDLETAVSPRGAAEADAFAGDAAALNDPEYAKDAYDESEYEAEGADEAEADDDYYEDADAETEEGSDDSFAEDADDEYGEETDEGDDDADGPFDSYEDPETDEEDSDEESGEDEETASDDASGELPVKDAADSGEEPCEAGSFETVEDADAEPEESDSEKEVSEKEVSEKEDSEEADLQEPESGETASEEENREQAKDSETDGDTAEPEDPEDLFGEKEPFNPDPDEIIAIVNCIGMENLAELHNQLIQFYGDNGKDIYQALKSGALSIEKREWGTDEKFLYYCALILRHSDEPEESLTEESIREFAEFVQGAESKRKNLNSLRYALLKHYGKEKGRRYYFMLKPYVKVLNQM